MAIETVAAGKVNLKGVVTDAFGLDEAQKAMVLRQLLKDICIRKRLLPIVAKNEAG